MTERATHQNFRTLAEARGALCSVLSSARREVWIATPHLWRDVFDHADVLEAVKGFALSSQYATIHMQVASTRYWQTSGHRWLPLIQRLPSRFDLRMFQSGYWERNGFVEHQVFADRSLAWCVRSEAPLVGVWSERDPAQVKLWQSDFIARARHTREPSHLRRLA